jgi:hypothetical protein
MKAVIASKLSLCLAALAAFGPLAGAHADYVTAFSAGFEGYNAGAIDMNLPSGANQSPNGGPGNPWFGPLPPNAIVVGATNSVTPHSGTNMLMGGQTIYAGQNWYNLCYRVRGGQVIYGNFAFDWWFYDPSGAGGVGYQDCIAVASYRTTPSNTDYPGTGDLAVVPYQQLCLGAAWNQSAGFDGTKYQCRNMGATGYNDGWNNTGTARSVGWHHARIIAGPPTNNMAMISYYIDDMVVPTFNQLNADNHGFNVIEINAGWGSTFGYLDDISFALAAPPNIVGTRSGTDLLMNWPGGYILQSASVVTGPYTDLAGDAGNPGSYTYHFTSGPKQFFRLRN